MVSCTWSVYCPRHFQLISTMSASFLISEDVRSRMKSRPFQQITINQSSCLLLPGLLYLDSVVFFPVYPEFWKNEVPSHRTTYFTKSGLYRGNARLSHVTLKLGNILTRELYTRLSEHQAAVRNHERWKRNTECKWCTHKAPHSLQRHELPELPWPTISQTPWVESQCKYGENTERIPKTRRRSIKNHITQTNGWLQNLWVYSFINGNIA